jgi:LysM repeat protein
MSEQNYISNYSSNIANSKTVETTSNTSLDKTSEKKSTPIPVGQNNNESQKSTLLKEPQKPKIAGVKENYYPQSGETTFSIATKHHISIDELLKANPGMDKDKIYQNKAINVPYRNDKDWEKYEKDVDAYENQQLALWQQEQDAKRAEALNNKKDQATAMIQKAKELKYDESYNFTIDEKSGDIIITLKKDMELGNISKDFRLPAGHLRAKNPDITTKYTPENHFNLDRQIRVSDWDGADAKKGDTFIVDPNAFRPSAGFLKDLFE